MMWQRLHDSGFKNLFLCTGEPKASLNLPSFFKGVIDKDFPRHLFENKLQQKSIS